MKKYIKLNKISQNHCGRTHTHTHGNLINNGGVRNDTSR